MSSGEFLVCEASHSLRLRHCLFMRWPRCSNATPAYELQFAMNHVRASRQTLRSDMPCRHCGRSRDNQTKDKSDRSQQSWDLLWHAQDTVDHLARSWIRSKCLGALQTSVVDISSLKYILCRVTFVPSMCKLVAKVYRWRSADIQRLCL